MTGDPRERLLDLLAARELGELPPRDAKELAALLQARPDLGALAGGDGVVDRLLRYALRDNPSPDAFVRGVSARIGAEADGERFVRGVMDRSPLAPARRTRRSRPRSGSAPGAWIFWGAAAACILILVLASAATSPKALPAAGARITEIARLPEPAPPAAQRREEPRLPPPEPPPPAPEPRPEPAPSPAPAPAPETVPPRPDPAPPPDPPPSAPPPRSTEAPAVVARVERVQGDVRGARAGDALLAGQGLETGDRGNASVRYPDGTCLELGAEAAARGFADGDAGKRLELDRGALSADVRRQPAGRSFVILTPHAEVRVLGTRFSLLVEPDSTRLETREGRVRATRREDGAAVEVGPDHYAVVGKGLALAARPIPRVLLAEDFEDPRAVAARWLGVRGGFPTTAAGRIEIDLSPRPGDPYPSSWHEAGGLIGRTPIRVPFRLEVDVDVTHRHPNLIAAILFLPRPARQSAEEWPNLFWVCFRGDALSIARGDADASAPVRTAGDFPRRDRWTVQMDAQELRATVNGRETARFRHDRRDPAVFLYPNANAKLDAPQGARVRFDNLRVEELPR
jgi:hypothetical protein